MPISSQLLAVFIDALERIQEPRFFQTERGYQGELLAELRTRLADAAFPGDPVVEQEYQKRIRLHDIKIRPDIIIHTPFERGFNKRRDQGNFVAIELKRDASETEAREAFANLAQMKEVLQYPLTIFINIDSNETHAAACPRSIADQTVCFAVHMENGKTIVRSQSPATQ